MSGSFSVSTSNSYISGTVSWSESNVSDANNTSDVTATMKLSRTNTGYTSYGTDTFHVTINGSTHSNTLSYSLTYNSNTTMVSGTTTVTHDSDGSKSITISWGGGGGSGGVFSVNSGSGTAKLTTIPRASSVSSSVSWTAGTDNLSVSIDRASSSFTHTVEVQVYTRTTSAWTTVATRTGIGSSTTVNFSSSENTNIYSYMEQYENMSARIYLITYSGSTQIGTAYSSTGTVYGAAIGKISFSNFNIGDNIPATISPMYSGFTYTAVMTFGSWSKTWSLTVPSSGTSLSTTLTFTSTDISNMYAQIPNANSGTGNVEITTQYGGVDVNNGAPSPEYNPNFGFTCYVKSGSSNPTFSSSSISYLDTNTTTTGLTGNNQYIIQGQSSFRATIGTAATGVNSATINHYSVSIDGQTKTINTTGNVDFGTLKSSSNISLTVTAVDSRGNSTAVSKTVTIVPYSPPVISTKATRENGFDASTDITLSGSYSLLTISGAAKNSLTTVQFQYKKSTDSTYPAATSFSYTTSSGTYTATTVTETFDNLLSWNVQITVQDKLTTSTVVLTVGPGSPILFIDADKGSVGVGKFPANIGTLEVNGGVSPEISGFVGTEDITAYPYGMTVQYNGGSSMPNSLGTLVTFNQSINRNYQLFNVKDTNDLYIRHRISTSTWSGWNKFFHDGNDGSGSGLDADTVDGKQASSLMWMTNANGYDGLQGPNSGTSNWIRTTTNGIIPYQSGGASSLGTSSWPFNYVYSKAVDITGSANAGVVHFDNSGNWSSVDAGIWSDNASNFGFSASGSANMNVWVDGDLTVGGNFIGEGAQATIEAASGGGMNFGNDSSGNRIWTMDWYNRTYSSGTVSIVQTTSGTAGRSTSASKYKLVIEDISDDLPKRMLDLNPKSWWDKALVENYSNALATGQEMDEDLGYLERAYGLIAEDLEDVGLEQFVFYGPADNQGNREVEAIYYDRMWVLLIPLVKELYDRIEVLEDKLRRR